MRALSGWLGLAVACSAFCVPAFAQAKAAVPLPGDRLLALAGAGYEKASRWAAIARIEAVLRHVGLPPLADGPHSGVISAKFEKAPAYEERNELSNTILLVKGSAKLDFVQDAVVIADGDVHIAHVARSIVMAAGSIRISHESPLIPDADPGGLYFTKGSIEFSHCTRPTFYAVKGAVAPCSATGFNTDIKRSSTVYVGTISKLGGLPLFREEPPGSGRAGTIVSSGESMSYSGVRCADAPDIASLHSAILPTARRQSNCPHIDSAAVSCGLGPKGEPQEKWTFSLCGKTVSMYSSKDSLAAPRPQEAPTPSRRSISIKTDDRIPEGRGPD